MARPSILSTPFNRSDPVVLAAPVIMPGLLTRREFAALLGAAAALVWWYLTPGLWLPLAGGFAFLVVVLTSPLAGVVLALWMVPWLRYPKELDLGGLGVALMGRTAPVEISLGEFTILMTFAAWLLRAGWDWWGNSHRSGQGEKPARGEPVEPPVACPSTSSGRAGFSPSSGRAGFSPPVAMLPTPVGDSPDVQGNASGPAHWAWWRQVLVSPLGLLLIVATLSLTWSEFLRFSLREYRTVIVEPALFALVVWDVARARRAWWLLLWALVALGTAAAVVSLGGFFTGTAITTAEGVVRAAAIYDSPNHLGLLLGRITPVAVALALFAPLPTRAWSLLALSLALMVAALTLTYSRGAWLAVGAALLFLAAAQGRRVLIGLAVAGVVAAAVALSLVPVERLASATTSSQRLYLWQASVTMLRDHPLTGVGLDNFLYHYPRYMLPEAWREPDLSHPHNLLLDFWLRLGILGMALLGWLQVRFWRQAWSVLRRADPWQRAGALALMGGMVDFLAHGLVDNSFFLIDMAVIFWLVVALMDGLARWDTAISPHPKKGRQA